MFETKANVMYFNNKNLQREEKYELTLHAFDCYHI